MKKLRRNLSCLTCKKPNQKRLWKHRCQACYKMLMRYESVNFRLCTIYNGLKQRCTNDKLIKAKYYIGMKYCTKKEFIERFINDKKFLRLFNHWKQSGKKYHLVPSIDRINNEKGYEIDNLQFITHSDNCRKDSQTTPVMAIKNEELVGLYYSLNDAVTQLGVQQSNAWKVLNGQRPHTMGYIFERMDYE